MKKLTLSPGNPLLARVDGIPLAIYFHAWLIKRGIFYTMAGAYVRATLHLAEEFQANPADITSRAVMMFTEREGMLPSNASTYTDAHWLWKEFWTTYKGKSLPKGWPTTTGIIADVLGWKSRMVVKALKYYAVEQGIPLEDFEKKFGAGWKAYVVPVEFFRYAEKVKREDDARWKSPPAEVAGT